MRALSHYRLPLRSPDGVVVAHLVLTPEKDEEKWGGIETSPLVELSSSESKEYGETVVQMREAERYEYEIEREDSGTELQLRCSLATRRRNLKPGSADAGRIDTGSFCGTLLLEAVSRTEDAHLVASGLIDIRSVKLDYRTEYRGMLRRLSEELAGLVVDIRSSAKLGFLSSFEERKDRGWLQIQLEFLREILDSVEFTTALQRIVSFPHERLTEVSEHVATTRLGKWNKSSLIQLLHKSPRVEVPEHHPLRRNPGLATVADRVSASHKSRDLDTPENRFIRFALRNFRAFVASAQEAFQSEAGWGVAIKLTERILSFLDDWLSRGFFHEIGELRYVPLNSPVLQRRSGYREILRWWLRFRTAAEISWAGGEDLFLAGQRDVASLYEYWLFFELLDWFCRKCGAGNRPPIDQLVDGLEEGAANLKLKKRNELGPFVGMFAGESRRLNARFAYNQRFEVTSERKEAGSWTRRLHPDYTLTFWPEGFSQAEAERLELLVNVHFDAKYRVETIETLFGILDSDDADEESDGNYKRQDLLKMHAYRDAIKRSQGAYVLYPGRRSGQTPFKQFHEILPGLGAFPIAPDETGTAVGMSNLEAFMDAVLAHLANRTTSLERLSYHVAESYTGKDNPVPYGVLRLPEADVYGMEYRALPPAEHMVLAAWYQNDAQRALAEDPAGLTFVRLGRRRGALHVHPNLARVRQIALRTHSGTVAPGLLLLREPGFRIYTRTELRAMLTAHPARGRVATWQADADENDDTFIYAVFQTASDPTYAGQQWNPGRIMELVEAFEVDARNRPVANVGRTSPYPRMLPLSGFLKARI